MELSPNTNIYILSWVLVSIEWWYELNGDMNEALDWVVVEKWSSLNQLSTTVWFFLLMGRGLTSPPSTLPLLCLNSCVLTLLSKVPSSAVVKVSLSSWLFVFSASMYIHTLAMVICLSVLSACWIPNLGFLFLWRMYGFSSPCVEFPLSSCIIACF